MLILLPPSEGKAAPARRGKPVDLAALSFPELTTARAAMLDRLARISAREDAHAVLGVGASLAEEVQRNTRLAELPARAASALYTGVLYAALDWPSARLTRFGSALPPPWANAADTLCPRTIEMTSK